MMCSVSRGGCEFPTQANSSSGYGGTGEVGRRRGGEEEGRRKRGRGRGGVEVEG